METTDSSPDLMGGTVVFRGTRVPVQTLVDYLAAGDTVPQAGWAGVKNGRLLKLAEVNSRVLQVIVSIRRGEVVGIGA